MTEDEFVLVDAALPEMAATNIYVLECGSCTATRDCPDEEYFTDLKAVADKALADANRRGNEGADETGSGSSDIPRKG